MGKGETWGWETWERGTWGKERLGEGRPGRGETCWKGRPGGGDRVEGDLGEGDLGEERLGRETWGRRSVGGNLGEEKPEGGGPGGGEGTWGEGEDPGEGDLVEKSQGGGQPTGTERPLEAGRYIPCPVNLHYWDSEEDFGKESIPFCLFNNSFKNVYFFWLHRLLVAACGIYSSWCQSFS